MSEVLRRADDHGVRVLLVGDGGELGHRVPADRSELSGDPGLGGPGTASAAPGHRRPGRGSRSSPPPPAGHHGGTGRYPADVHGQEPAALAGGRGRRAQPAARSEVPRAVDANQDQRRPVGTDLEIGRRGQPTWPSCQPARPLAGADIRLGGPSHVTAHITDQVDVHARPPGTRRAAPWCSQENWPRKSATGAVTAAVAGNDVAAGMLDDQRVGEPPGQQQRVAPGHDHVGPAGHVHRRHRELVPEQPGVLRAVAGEPADHDREPELHRRGGALAQRAKRPAATDGAVSDVTSSARRSRGSRGQRGHLPTQDRARPAVAVQAQHAQVPRPLPGGGHG